MFFSGRVYDDLYLISVETLITTECSRHVTCNKQSEQCERDAHFDNGSEQENLSTRKAYSRDIDQCKYLARRKSTAPWQTRRIRAEALQSAEHLRSSYLFVRVCGYVVKEGGQQVHTSRSG